MDEDVKQDPKEKISRAAGDWLRDGALIAFAFMIGWWAHTGRTVSAQGAEMRFQFQNLDTSTALTLYYPDQNTIYVYQSALMGNSNLNCAYEFQLGAPGAMVQRKQCKPPRFQP